MSKAGLAGRLEPCAPCDRNRIELLVVQLGQRTCVPRRVDDDFLVVEGRVEVRDDAGLPARRVGLAPGRPDREGLGWRAILAACAERTLLELLGGRRLDRSALRSGPPRPRRRDGDDPA
jgi:hypothetical protein